MIKKKYNITGSYLLSVGINPRKNTNRIIEAFTKLKGKEKFKLVLIGHPFMKVKQADGIRMLGQVPTQDLPALYSGAEGLIYPSLYEGFGLPILEAFKCKTPVVTSNLGSLKEVAADAAVLVNPESVNSITQGIEEAMDKGEELVVKGVKRVKKFTWKNTAKETIKTYAKG